VSLPSLQLQRQGGHHDEFADPLGCGIGRVSPKIFTKLFMERTMITNNGITDSDTAIESPEETLEQAKSRWDRRIGLDSTIDDQGNLLYRTSTGCPVALAELHRGTDGRFQISIGHSVSLRQDWLREIAILADQENANPPSEVIREHGDEPLDRTVSERSASGARCGLDPDTSDEIASEIIAYANAKLIGLIDSSFEECLVWDRGDCEWDCSGALKCLDEPEEIFEQLQSVDDVLETHTGDSTPTYMSGYGLEYETWGEDFEKDIEHRLKAQLEERLGEDTVDDWDDELLDWTSEIYDLVTLSAQSHFDQTRQRIAEGISHGTGEDETTEDIPALKDHDC